MASDCVLHFKVDSEMVEAGDASFLAVTLSTVANDSTLDTELIIIPDVSEQE